MRQKNVSSIAINQPSFTVTNNKAAFFVTNSILTNETQRFAVKTNETMSSKPSNVVSEPFLVVSNSVGSQSAVVDSTRKIVSLRDSSGQQVWSVDVINGVKNIITTDSKIRDVEFDSSGNLLVTIGKHTFASIDAKSGKLLFQGSD